MANNFKPNLQLDKILFSKKRFIKVCSRVVCKHCNLILLFWQTILEAILKLTSKKKSSYGWFFVFRKLPIFTMYTESPKDCTILQNSLQLFYDGDCSKELNIAQNGSETGASFCQVCLQSIAALWYFALLDVYCRTPHTADIHTSCLGYSHKSKENAIQYRVLQYSVV